MATGHLGGVLRRMIAVVAWATLAAVSGCGGVGVESSLSAAQVRFVEVSPGAPEMDFYVNGTGAAYNVDFANFTSYLPVSPGTASLSVTPAGTAQTVATAQGTLNGGRQYTAVVSRGLGSLQERVYQDQDTAAPAGLMAVRVLNEVEGGVPVTVYVAGTAGGGAAPLGGMTLAVGAASGYLTVPANGTYTLTATVAEGALNVPVGSVTLKARSGAVHTVVFARATGALASARGVVGFVLNDVEAP